MRLLDARALIHEGVSRLVDDTEVGKPRYAIVSHTWAQEEVLFEDIALGPYHEVDSLTEEQRATRGYDLNSRTRYWKNSQANFWKRSSLFRDTNRPSVQPVICRSCKSRTQYTIRKQGPHIKAGWKKIWSACLEACRDGFDYVWIDTCCIDKSSSSELAEALNSMFEWYATSSACYVMLDDCGLCLNRNKAQCGSIKSQLLDECTTAQISTCRWFSRGWTLQELIAPSELKFFDRDWRSLRSRSEILGVLSDVTGIDESVFQRPRPSYLVDRNTDIKDALTNIPVATKMSWAANRKTTRVEDRAYSLLGLFGVNMPLLYGEGNKAFFRLQEEIIRYSNDNSIFTWEFTTDHDWVWRGNQLLAPSPDCFAWLLALRTKGLQFQSCTTNPALYAELDGNFEITPKALRITVPLFNWHDDEKSNEEGRDLIKSMGSKFDVSSKKSHALLNCNLAGLLDSSIIRIALRLSHQYVGDRYLVSQVVTEERGCNELGENIIPRTELGFNNRHRLALYLDDWQIMEGSQETQAVTIRRDIDFEYL